MASAGVDDASDGAADAVTDAPVRRLVVAQVRGLHGLRGAVRLEVLSDDPARFEPGARLFPEGDPRPLTVEWVQSDGPGLLVRFRELSDRTSVEPLRDVYLEAEVGADALPQGSWYWHEIIGARVTTGSGDDLGTVTDVFRAGGGEVFVVEGPHGEIMVPAVQAVMLEFQPAEGRIVVDADALALDEPEPRSRVRGRRTTRARKAAERAQGIGSAPDAAAPDAAAPDTAAPTD